GRALGSGTRGGEPVQSRAARSARCPRDTGGRCTGIARAPSPAARPRHLGSGPCGDDRALRSGGHYQHPAPCACPRARHRDAKRSPRTRHHGAGRRPRRTLRSRSRVGRDARALRGSRRQPCDQQRAGGGLHGERRPPSSGKPLLIRICLADDQALVRSGLKALLGLLGGIEVVAEADDGEAAVAAALSSDPDVLLLDVRMPKLSGVQVIERLARQSRLPPTLLLTTFEDDAALIHGVKAGARGYLLKGVSPDTLHEAIRIVAGGGTYLYAPLV